MLAASLHTSSIPSALASFSPPQNDLQPANLSLSRAACVPAATHFFLPYLCRTDTSWAAIFLKGRPQPGLLATFTSAISPPKASNMPSQAGRSLARALGIKLRDSDPWKDNVTLGETVLSRPGNSFFEEHPTVPGFFMGLRPSRQQASDYTLSLFPFLSWISKYNLKWFLGDLVAGKVPFCNTKCPLCSLYLQASPLGPWLFRRAWPTPSSPT